MFLGIWTLSRMFWRPACFISSFLEIRTLFKLLRYISRLFTCFRVLWPTRWSVSEYSDDDVTQMDDAIVFDVVPSWQLPVAVWERVHAQCLITHLLTYWTAVHVTKQPRPLPLPQSEIALYCSPHPPSLICLANPFDSNFNRNYFAYLIPKRSAFYFSNVCLKSYVMVCW